MTVIVGLRKKMLEDSVSAHVYKEVSKTTLLEPPCTTMKGGPRNCFLEGDRGGGGSNCCTC